MEWITGGVCAAKGFRAAGCAAGIKKDGSADMALIACDVPCTVAGTFTSNVVKAAPVLWDRAFVAEGRPARAVLVNSGVANACTGDEGYGYCRESAEACGKALGIPYSNVLVASTGVIGVQLPIGKIRDGAAKLSGLLADTEEAATDAAKAIMTTDTVHKEKAVSFTLGDGTTAHLGGCTKGSGMIHPNMCTMLCFLTTDAAISREMLQSALAEVVPDTFNMVSVDGDTSTNDTCLLLASGLAGNAEITEKDADYQIVRDALFEVLTELSRMMAKDGEGATCLFQCDVQGAETKEQAKILARSVVSSSLVKAMIAGHDANWGRVLCAMGYSGAAFDADKVSLTFTSEAGSIEIFKDGRGLPFDEEFATRILSEEEIHAVADLHAGNCSASAWGCDLTHEYVNINADYRS